MSTIKLPKLEKHSFSAPFTDTDFYGTRKVSDNFALGGDAKAAKNFVRLTPDRQSKKGAVWSESELGVDTFTSIVQFRISGKGERFFGDGLAIWTSLSAQYSLEDLQLDEKAAKEDGDGGDGDGGRHGRALAEEEDEVVAAEDEDVVDEDLDFGYHGYGRYPYMDDDFGWRGGNEWLMGDFHGYIPKFTGVGVIFDTYVNLDSPHKDVTVLWNNGTRSIKDMYSTAVGCNAEVRYHQKRDDFEPAKALSRAKLVMKDNLLAVFIDERNNGKWRECAQLKVPLPAGWTSHAHIGLTASTGDLSDNHDVLRLDTYDTHEAAEQSETQTRDAPKHVFAKDATDTERIAQLENVINLMLVKMDMMEHHTEHAFVEMEEYVDTAAERMKNQDFALEDAVALLESKVKKIEGGLKTEMADKIDVVVTGMGEWKTPFLIVLVLIVGGMLIITRWYRRLLKSHIL